MARHALVLALLCAGPLAFLVPEASAQTPTPTWSVSVSPGKASEGNATYDANDSSTYKTATVTITLANGVGNNLYRVNLRFYGTATRQTDYKWFDQEGDDHSQSRGFLNIFASRTSPTYQFTLRILGDTTAEPDETIIARLGSAGSIGVVVSQISHTAGSATYTIENDDGRTVTLSSSRTTLTEGGSGGADRTTLTATLSSAAPTGGVTIPLAAVSGTATTAASGDYTLPASIAIAQGNTTGTTTLIATNDTADEPRETLRIGFGALPSGVTAGATSHVDLTIDDNDPTVVSLARTGIGAITEGSKAEFTVTLSRALGKIEVIDAPLSIGGTNVTTGDWSLALKSGQGLNTGVTLSGANTATPTVRFSGAGAQTATLELTATEDGTAESDGSETFEIALGTNRQFDAKTGTNVSGGADPHGTDNDFSVRVNEGLPVVRFASATSNADEDDGTVDVRVNLNPPPTSDIRLFYTVSGSATEGSDYTALPGSVAVPATTASVDIPVAIRDDTKGESAETVILTLSSNTGYTVGNPSKHTLTINNDDGPPGGTGTNNNTGGTPPPPPPPPTVRLAVSPNPVSEGEAVTVTLTLSRVLSNPVTIPLTLTAGTADAGDYGTLPSITIPAGAVTGTGTLSTLADADTDDETVTVAFGTLPATVTAGTPATVLLTLTDTSPTQLDRLKEAIRRTLSAIGRRTLTGALDQLGARLAEPGTGATLTLNGHTIELGASGVSSVPASLVPAAPACGPGHAQDAGAPRCPAGAGPPTAPLSLAALLQASAFTLPLQAATKAGLSPTGPRWALWGRGDVGTFKGRPDAGTAYTGRARIGWLGLDARHGPWVAGLAVSHGTGTADYALVAGTPGRLDTSVTTVHPYGRWTVADGLDLRVVLGAGAGRARHAPGVGPRTSAPLTLWLGSLGVRQVLPSVAGFTAAVRADASLTRIELGAGPDFVTDLSADSWRGRAGVEVARTLALAPETAVAPFVEAAVRRDGGDGIRGTGLEVAGGLRYTAPRVQVEARGRVLAAYTQGGTHEQGVSVTARVGPGAQGRGWSLALLPRWGAAPTGAQALWAADLPTHAATAPAPAALEAQVGYGVGLAPLGLLTPFAEAGLTGETTRHLRLGARLAAPRVNLRMTLAGEQRTQAGTRPVQALRLEVHWQF